MTYCIFEFVKAFFSQSIAFNVNLRFQISVPKVCLVSTRSLSDPLNITDTWWWRSLGEEPNTQLQFDSLATCRTHYLIWKHLLLLSHIGLATCQLVTSTSPKQKAKGFIWPYKCVCVCVFVYFIYLYICIFYLDIFHSSYYSLHLFIILS